MNKESRTLWVEYFRFELLYAHKLRARRSVLGIEDAGVAEGAEESDAAVQAVLDGAVALGRLSAPLLSLSLCSSCSSRVSSEHR